MPKLMTLHSSQKEACTSKQRQNIDVETQRIQNIVIDISNIILRDKTQLVAEVESGILDRSILEVEIVKIIDKNGYSIYSRDNLIESVFDWMFGYGPLQYLIDDDEISDIDFSRYYFCTIKKNGIKEKIDTMFPDEKTFENYIKHIITRRGGILNEADPHCRVSDYTKRLRINGSIYPRNRSGAALQIRKHPMHSPDFEMLIERGMMNKQVAELLKKLSNSSARIFIIGKGASGKTTILRAIINSFSELESVLLAEKDSEIYPDNPGIVCQQIKRKDEGGKEVTLQDLVNDGLTMSLDTYVVGEMIGAESWTIISIGLNGHRILLTGHANSAEDAFPRLLTAVKESGINLPDSTLYEIFSKSIDILIYMRSYKVVEISEIIGFDKKQNEPILNPIYNFNIESINSDERITGTCGQIKKLKGRLAEEFKARGYEL